MVHTLYATLKKYRTVICSIIFLVLYSVSISSAAPLYTSTNTTLDPQCLPSNVDCTVSQALTTEAVAEGGGVLYFTNNRAVTALTGQNISLFTNDSGYLAVNSSNSSVATTTLSAPSVQDSNFFGFRAGYQGVSSTNSNFFGSFAGAFTSTAAYSNFFGASAGQNATDAAYSNFLGFNAGYGASAANNSNFLGRNAGQSATNAANSNFFGSGAGQNATNAANSIFIGNNAGLSDTVNNTSNGLSSILIGSYTNTGGFTNSILLGSGTNGSPIANTQANQFMLAPTIINARFRGVNYTFPSAQASVSGQVLTNDASGVLSWTTISSGIAVSTSNNSIASTTLDTTEISNSNFLGYRAGKSATNATNSNFLGQNAGNGATSAAGSNFFGQAAGQSATNATSSNFFGQSAGYGATSANQSNFLGTSSGYGATSASRSNFIGQTAGENASSASDSNFIGQSSGQNATSASFSNFVGKAAGQNAANAIASNFIGSFAGVNATNASFSNLFGYQVGKTFTLNNIGSNNIIIGTNISLGNAVANSINIGGVLFGSGAYATTTGNPSITAVTTGKIGIATIPTQYTLEVGNSSVSGIVSSFQNSSGTCTINPTTTSLSCSSDRNLKKDITALDTDTLNKVLSLQPVTYHWNTESDTDSTHAGFIAQEVEAIFPDLVSTDPNTGLKSLAYTGLIPYTVKAIQDINITITTLADTTKTNSLRESLIAWLSGDNNGIAKIKSMEIDTQTVNTKNLCVDGICVTKEQFKAIIERSLVEQSVQIPQTVTETPVLEEDIVTPDPVVSETPTSDILETQDVSEDPPVAPSETPIE